MDTNGVESCFQIKKKRLQIRKKMSSINNKYCAINTTVLKNENSYPLSIQNEFCNGQAFDSLADSL